MQCCQFRDPILKLRHLRIVKSSCSHDISKVLDSVAHLLDFALRPLSFMRLEPRTWCTLVLPALFEGNMVSHSVLIEGCIGWCFTRARARLKISTTSVGECFRGGSSTDINKSIFVRQSKMFSEHIANLEAIQGSYLLHGVSDIDNPH